MNNFKKLAMTAGAIGALGVAGSFGTFSAFTAAESSTPSISAGDVKIVNDFSLPDLTNLGTRDNGLAAADGKRVGHISVVNRGTLPINVWVDFDGTVAEVPGQNFSSNALAENINIDSSYSPSFTPIGDDATRLWVLNRRNLSPLPDPNTGAPLVLQPNTSQTVYFRMWLREGVGHLAGLDNDMMDQVLSNEKVTVKAIEAGGNDFGPAPTPATPNYDNGL